MTIKTYTYHLHELTDYINWLYFFIVGDFLPNLRLSPANMPVRPASRLG